MIIMGGKGLWNMIIMKVHRGANLEKNKHNFSLGHYLDSTKEKFWLA